MIPLLLPNTTVYLAGSSAGNTAPVFDNATHTLTNASTITAYLPKARVGSSYIITTPNTALCNLTCVDSDTFFGYTVPSTTVIKINSFYQWVKVECYVAGTWHVFFPERTGVMSGGSVTGTNAKTLLAQISLPPYLDGSTYRVLDITSLMYNVGALSNKQYFFELNGVDIGSLVYAASLTGETRIQITCYLNSSASQQNTHMFIRYNGVILLFYTSTLANTMTATNTLALYGKHANITTDVLGHRLTFVKLEYTNSSYGC